MSQIPVEERLQVASAFYAQEAEIRRREEQREAAPESGGRGTLFSQWQRAQRWAPRDAALLVCGFEPSSYRSGQGENMQYIFARRLSGGSAASEGAFAHVREIEKKLMRRADPSSALVPSEFVEWCASEGIDTRWIDVALDSPPALSAKERIEGQQDCRLAEWRAMGGGVDEKGELTRFNEFEATQAGTVRSSAKTLRKDLHAAMHRQQQHRQGGSLWAALARE